MFDSVSKYLIENFSADFALWLLGSPVSLTRLEPSELSIEPIRADALILTNESDILHIEMQTSPDPNIPFRLLDYRIRLYRKYPERNVKQVVIYLKPNTSHLVKQNTFEISRTKHEFDIIRLWEQPPEFFLNSLGLLPFAVLSNTTDREQTLKQVATIINQIPNPKDQNSIVSVTAILAGLILDKELIRKLLRSDIMKESVIYQEILEEGFEKGIQEGVQKGRQEGHLEGRQEGVELVAKNLLSIGISVDQVAIATGLSFEELEKL